MQILTISVQIVSQGGQNEASGTF